MFVIVLVLVIEPFVLANTSTTSGTVDVTKIYFCPCQVTLSWKSGSGNERSTAGNVSRQRITIYAAFGPLH